MSGIRSFMGWSHIPDVDSTNPSDDNPFAGPKAPVPSKISVQMPTEDYLCRKLAKLNLTMTEGYPSRTTEAGSLPIDHFLRPPKPQTKWYGLYSEQQLDPATVTSWNTGPSKLNNSFGRISRKAVLAATPPASRRISQDALRRWERSAREASVVCNQSASFNRCLFKVQGDMNAQLKVIKSENKGKVSNKLTEAAEELQFLMDFNSNITQAAAKAMEHLTDFVFLTMGNITLTRRDSYLSHLKNGLLEALHQLIDKNAVELVRNKNSLSFFNRLFLVPKPNNKWRPILDLSRLNVFLKTEKFKMETPETIRTSLQQGEWVTSIDFKDAYFHIPIQEQSRKYLRFHVQGQTYQFKALPFGLSTAPLEFTVVAKEVKLMATFKGIRIHQYLDDWLVRARSHRVCLQHTQELVRTCQNLGWLVNLDKSELEPKQVFDFVGYQFDLEVGRVRPTPDRWQTLQRKILEMLHQPTCPVRQFMSLIGLLTATEKQVHLGRLHMRPIQWHLKNTWRVPESLEKVIPIPKPLHPHLRWWLQEDNVLSGQTLHPIRHALQLFTDASKEGWGAHLNDSTARGSWSLPESKLHINYLELKAVLLALKEFGDLCTGQIVKVKAHDVRAFAASRAFHSGMSLEQILSACHWKSHNTFTQFYLKDVAWADSELYHLGPVVAAQQIHQQTSS